MSDTDIELHNNPSQNEHMVTISHNTNNIWLGNMQEKIKIAKRKKNDANYIFIALIIMITLINIVTILFDLFNIFNFSFLFVTGIILIVIVTQYRKCMIRYAEALQKIYNILHTTPTVDRITLINALGTTDREYIQLEILPHLMD